MPTDLHARAAHQRTLITDAAGVVTARLATARGELQLRHPDPASVSRDDWVTALGASQHQQLTRAALASVRTEQGLVREKIAGIANPADAETFEDELRELMIDEASLRRELRVADERVSAATAAIERLADLARQAEGEGRQAEDRTAWGLEHAELGSRLRDVLTDPPLDTIVVDADAVLNGPELTAADDRLDQLLPSELRARAEARSDEALAVVTSTQERLATLRDEADAVAVGTDPLTAAVAAAERALLSAERGLSDYAAGAPGGLARAVAALERVADHPDLSTAQADAIGTANHAAGVTAIGHEEDLAAALTAADALQRDLDDAILEALIEDPDRDPETVQAVSDARDALEAPAIQTPLSDARDAYDGDSRRALDEWEVEVPPSLWAALDEFVEARRTLERLADAGSRDALVQALDDAEDALAEALDDRDLALRTRWAIQLDEAARVGAATAAAASATERRRHYLQGDGPAGRSPAQL